jgi:CheY-like chemotaxis protein
MFDILIFTKAQEVLLDLERIVRDSGFRAKSTTEYEACFSWLDIRPFSLAILDAAAGVGKIRDLTEGLWRLNPDCRVIAFSNDEATILEPLLFGAEAVATHEIAGVLQTALATVKEQQHGDISLEHILVVEDLDSPRDILCMFLEGLGYSKITGVSSGIEALQLLIENPGTFTAVLTDIRMPQMSGDELIKEIRRTAGLDRIPVVVLTAYGTPDCLIDSLRAGATGFLVKPPKKPDLKRELDRAHRVRRSGASVRLVPKDKVDSLYALLEDKGLV